MKAILGLAALLLSFGCGETHSGPDAAKDVDSGFADSGFADAGATEDSGTADAGQVERDAAVIDGSLTGTSLEGIAVAWDAPVVLCETSHFGGSAEDLADAALEKVQVSLRPHPRTSLEPSALATATLDQGRIDRGPFSADQFRVEGAASTLVHWELTGPPESATLYAEIAHGLGAAGTLFEVISVHRSAGDQRPVRYDGDTPEAGFAYQPPDTERFPLTTCDGPSNLETAAVVMTAFRGDEFVTVLREQRTRLVAAGSAPVYPTRAEALLSSHLQYGEAILAEGRWSQQYTASLHNWNEFSRIRFDRDLRWSYLVFGPLAKGDMPSYPPTIPKQIDLAGVNNSGGGNGALELTTVTLPAGTTTAETYDVEIDWTRVDETQLARELIGCTTPEIVTIWGVSAASEYLFQLGYCTANAPLSELALFVPIYFETNPRLAGQRFDAGAISQVTIGGLPGVEIDLGTHSVQLTQDHLFVLDAARSTLDESWYYGTVLFQTSIFSGGRAELSATNEAAGVHATLERQWVGQGAGNSGIFAPIAFELTFGAETHRVSAWDKLDYVNTHHNWDDSLECDDGELRMSWRVLGFGQEYQVSASRLSDGVEVLPATVLTEP